MAQSVNTKSIPITIHTIVDQLYTLLQVSLHRAQKHKLKRGEIRITGTLLDIYRLSLSANDLPTSLSLTFPVSIGTCRHVIYNVSNHFRCTIRVPNHYESFRMSFKIKKSTDLLRLHALKFLSKLSQNFHKMIPSSMLIRKFQSSKICNWERTYNTHCVAIYTNYIADITATKSFLIFWPFSFFEGGRSKKSYGTTRRSTASFMRHISVHRIIFLDDDNMNYTTIEECKLWIIAT